MTSSLIRRLSAPLLGVVLVAAACVSDDPDPNVATVSPDSDLVMVMGEFWFLPSVITVTEGTTIRITLVNEGLVDHEFMIGRDVNPGGGYAEDLLGMALVSAEGYGFEAMPPLDGGEGGGMEGMDAEAPHDEDEGEDAAEDAEAPHDEAEGEDAEAAPHGEDAGDGLVLHGSQITVRPGGKVQIVLEIPTGVTGEWSLGCFIEGHFEAGMKGTLSISASKA